MWLIADQILTLSSYKEAIGVLYFANTLHFSEFQTFDYFSQTVLTTRLDSVRSIEVDLRFLDGPRGDPLSEQWAKPALHIISTMRGLKSFVINITETGHLYQATDGTMRVDSWSREWDASMIECLKQLPSLNIDTYEVRIICTLSRDFATSLGDVPFRIGKIDSGPSCLSSNGHRDWELDNTLFAR